ncbi:hypothetical protein ACI8AK_05265 [Geodermatophilus sp. SYSU D00867]
MVLPLTQPDPTAKLREALRLLRLDIRPARRCLEATLGWLSRVASSEELLAEVARHPIRRPLFPRPAPFPRDRDASRLALAVLAARADLGGRFTDISQVAAVRPVDASALAVLIHVGCELAEGDRDTPPGSPPPTVGVLLPLRLETRFVAPSAVGGHWTLKVRVVPDAASLDRHQPTATADELDAVERLWVDADGDLSTDAGRAQWTRFAAQVGAAGRAAWLARTFSAVNDGAGGWTITRPGNARTEMAVSCVAGLPERLELWWVRGGAAPALAATLAVDRSRLTLDPPDVEAGQVRWWTSFAEAKDVRLGAELDLGTDPNDIDVLYVVGLGDDDPAELLRAHRDAGILGVLSLGAPTNAVAGEPAADLARDPEVWRQLLVAPGPQDGAAAVAYALTGSGTALGPLPGGDTNDIDVGQAMVAALWPAVWGHGLKDVWSLSDDGFALARWAGEHLLPEGPVPPVRIGDQPYGVLPVTSLTRWAPAAGDPAVEASLRDVLLGVRPLWIAAGEAGGTTAGADTARLLDLLAQVPSSPGYAWRWLLPLELVHGLWWAFGSGIGFAALHDWWTDLAQPVLDLGGHPARRYATLGWPQDLRIPLVEPDNIDVDFAEAVERILGFPPNVLASEDRRSELFQSWPNSLLLRLLVHARAVGAAEVARAAKQDTGPLLDPVAAANDTPTVLQRWGTQFDDSQLSGNIQSDLFHIAHDAAARLAPEPIEVLERVLRATLDTASHRIDPWVTGLAWGRLRRLTSGAGPARFALGAYGWVDAPRPRDVPLQPDEYLHAPSEAQALTAAILRDRSLFDAEPARWQIDLDSEGVRLAEHLAAEVRLGAHLSEALGRAVERAVAARAAVQRLRRDFPIRSEHDGRRVCDGLAVLTRFRTHPDSLLLTPAQLATLAPLAEAVDTYGDLLVAGAVFDVVSGRAALAARSMEAAAGLTAPPTLDVLRTPRTGRSVATTVITALPDAPAPAPVDASTSPACLAEPAVAAFLVATVGPPDGPAWTWQVLDGDGNPTSTVTLADVGLGPVDTLSLSVGDLHAAALAHSGGAALLPDPDTELAAHGRVRRLADLLGTRPVVPGDLTADTSTPSEAAVHGDLLARYTAVHGVAVDLQIALTAVTGGPEAGQRARLRDALRWGITPLTADAPDPGVLMARALAALTDRLGRSPTPAAAAALSVPLLAQALAELVSPEGRLPVLSRLPLDQLPVALAAEPPADGATPLDPDWLEVVAAVRAPLARLEAEQLLRRLTPDGEPLTAWTSRSGDPWQVDLGADAAEPVPPSTHLVAAFGPAGALDPGTEPGRPVALGLLDSWGETIPGTEQATQVAFHFDAPGARAPQAILLAVPPVTDQPLDTATLVTILAETRESARTRMADPAHLGAVATATPLTVLPVHDPGVDPSPSF